jgi:hypothetical protein
MPAMMIAIGQDCNDRYTSAARRNTMTTASPDDSTVRYGDRIQTRRASSSARPAQQEDWSQWEAWMEGHKKLLGEEVVEAIAQHLTDPLDKRIRALELELAQTRGAVDILRGKGAPGCFRAKGNYDSKTAYSYLDVVVKDSSSFVALKDAPGACPGDDWQMIACGGRRGPAGERGPAGPPGPTPTWTGATFNRNGWGIATRTGDAIPLLQSVSVDAQDFSLKFTAPDGSTLKISLLPLFQAYHRQTTSP